MVTYSGHKTKNRIRNRMAAPSYGPPAPYPFQKQPKRSDLRDPGPGRNPKFLEQKGGKTDYQKFRPGRSVPLIRQSQPLEFAYDPLGPSEEMQRYRHYRMMVRLGLMAKRINPFMTALDIAFNVAYELDWNNPFGEWMPEKPGGYEPPPGSQLCCRIGDRTEGVKVQQTSSSNCPPTGTFCGLGGQVPDGVDGQTVTQGGSGRYVKVFFGPVTQISPFSWRMSYDQIWQFDRGATLPRPPLTIPYREPQVAVRLPVYPLAPPAPVMTETFTPPPGYDLAPRAPGPGLKPYQLPAVEIRINPGGSKPPGHIPPRIAVHDRVPPMRPHKEKKHFLRDRTKIGKFLYGLYDKTTEAKDIIDILYDNLPRDKKCAGAKDLSSKSYCVWKNLEHLDIENAIEDLIKNHIEDKAWGKFYSYGRKSPFGSQLPGGTKPRIQLSQRT